MTRPECFYKDHLCRFVTGLSVGELLDKISEEIIDPIDSAIRSECRPDGEVFVDRMGLFMGSRFEFPTNDISETDLYAAFSKFRAWEEHVHPRDRCEAHGNYWGRTYVKIETAYATKDMDTFREGIVDLIDQIIHD